MYKIKKENYGNIYNCEVGDRMRTVTVILPRGTNKVVCAVYRMIDKSRDNGMLPRRQTKDNLTVSQAINSTLNRYASFILDDLEIDRDALIKAFEAEIRRNKEYPPLKLVS